MFRVSFVILALASALALNGCSQCSKQEGAEAPVAAPATDATPVDAAAMPSATPMDSTAAPAVPAGEGVPAATPAAEMTPAH